MKSLIPGLHSIVVANGHFYAGVSTEANTENLFLDLGTKTVSFNECDHDPIKFPEHWDATKAPLNATAIDSNKPDNDVFECVINKLDDWTLAGQDTVQVQICAPEHPQTIRFKNPLVVHPSEAPLMLKAKLAGHRARANMCLTIPNSDIDEKTEIKVPIDAAFYGGKDVDGYQKASVSVPALNTPYEIFISLEYEGVLDDGINMNPFLFLTDVKVEPDCEKIGSFSEPIVLADDPTNETLVWKNVPLHVFIAAKDSPATTIRLGQNEQIISSSDLAKIDLDEAKATYCFASRDTLNYLSLLPGGPVEHSPSTFSDLIRTLRDWPLHEILGPAPLVCPAWLAAQPSCAGCKTIAEILQTQIKPGTFFLHPGLKPIQVSQPVTILEIIEQIQNDDLYADLSVVNLSSYIENHRDLKTLENDPRAIFNHMWTYGPQENRLKFLGNRRLRSFTPQQNFLMQIKTVLRAELSSWKMHHTHNIETLTPFALKSLKADDSSVTALDRIFDNDLSNNDLAEMVRNYVSLSSQNLEETIYVLNDKEEQTEGHIEYRSVGSKVLTDQMLMSGVHKVPTRRVVYGVNIGGYDDFPVPPQLEDCSFYLITDAADIPKDSPWTIVRPTLSETDVKRQCLWYKTHPHWLFQEAEHVTWIDSNIRCKSQSEVFLMAHEAMSEVATFTHPDRDCIYDEAKTIIELRLDREDLVQEVCSQMRQEGFPEKYGLYETNVLYSRTQDLGVRAFFDTWWRNIYLGSRRDQMSFTFSAWQEGIEISPLDAGFSGKDSRFFTKTNHKSKAGRFV